MQGRLIFRPAAGACLAAALFCGSCSGRLSGLDGDLNEKYFRKAMEKLDVGDKDAAIHFFSRAIDRRPRNARAHLQLALLYDDAKNDYIRAIYHYERCLETWPNDEQRPKIEEYIKKARMVQASIFLSNSPITDERINALQRENVELRKSLHEVRKNLAQRIAGQLGQDSAMAMKDRGQGAAESQAGSAGAARTYVVLPGDTLAGIAGRFYGDPSKYRRIQEANKLNDSHKIKVGQKLLVP